MPEPTRISVSATAILNSFAALSSYTATNFGFSRRACSSSSFTLLDAASAATGIPICSATSTLCRPMEPVLPSIETDLTILIISF